MTEPRSNFGFQALAEELAQPPVMPSEVPALDLSAAPTQPKRVDRTSAALARDHAGEAGFKSRARPTTPPAPKTAPKRVSVGRRARGTGDSVTGTLSISGPAAVLHEFVRRASWERKTYTEMLQAFLDQAAEDSDPIPDTFMPFNK